MTLLENTEYMNLYMREMRFFRQSDISKSTILQMINLRLSLHS